MKKVLSMVLALALVLTALALPMSVSAATVEGKLTVSFDINDGSLAAINPGDTVKVDVVATAVDAAYNLNYWSVDVVYDATNLTFVGSGKANIVDLGGKVRIINEGDATPIATEGTDIATLQFTVKDTTPSSTTIQFTTNDIDTGFAQINGSNINSYAYTTTPKSFTVAENTSSVTIDNVAINNGATYYKGTPLSVVVTAAKATSITIKETAAVEATTLTSGAAHSVGAAGTYTITVVMPGKTDTYTFTYVAQEIKASLEVVTTDKKTAGYTTADTVTAVVKLAGLADGAKAAMVKFALDYDNTKLSLASATGENIVLGEDGIITYGTAGAETGTGNTESLATLTFDVVDSAAYGDVTFAINAESTDLALVTTMVNPTATPVAIPGSPQTVTIVPATDDAYYTATGNPEGVNAEAWKNVAYTYGVAKAADTIELKYIESTSEITEVTETSFTNASPLDVDGILIDAEANYYLVAKVGSVYKLVATLNNGTDVFFDKTKPSITGAETANMPDWKNVTTTIDLSGVSFTDALSTVKEKSYKYGTEEFTTFTGTEITVTAPENGVLETLTLKVVDKAGNEETANVTLKIDTVVPTVSLAKADQSAGKVTITVNANDVGSGIKADASVYYYSNTAIEGATLDSFGEMEANAITGATFEATSTGYYYVVVADNAGNKNFASIDVSIDQITFASDINVTLIKGGAEVNDGFLNTTEMAAKGIKKDAETVIDGNGTFTYVKVTVDAPDEADKYKNIVKVNENEFTEVEYTNGKVFDTVGDYVLTVTTQNKIDASDAVTETYKFSIVAPADMISPDGNKRYNIFDFAMIKTLVLNDKNLPDATNEFVGGLFSGDMTGDLTMDVNDFGAILNSLRAGETPGAYYNLPIMNQQASAVGE